MMMLDASVAPCVVFVVVCFCSSLLCVSIYMKGVLYVCVVVLRGLNMCSAIRERGHFSQRSTVQLTLQYAETRLLAGLLRTQLR